MNIADTYQKCGLTPSVAQLSLAKATLGERLDARGELESYLEYTGKSEYHAKRVEEETIIKGRKAGGSEYFVAPMAIHIACVEQHQPGVVLIVAPSKSEQARLVWQAVSRQLQRGFPGLITEIREGEGRILLANGNEIRIASANFRHLRGPLYIACFIDEAAFFFSDSEEDGGANPLALILDSIVGGMVATEHPLLALVSSPWIKAGVVFEHWRDRDSNPDRMVWRASTLAMNPHANQKLMERHRKERGENFYRREYLAEFSEDSFAYIESADVDAAIVPGTPFFPAKAGIRYCAGLDPGRRRDHFGAAIAHRESDTVIVDWCCEWKPGLLGLKYADILPQIWQKAREYRIRKIASDQIDFGGIEASIPVIGNRPEFEMERIVTGGAGGAELADVTRGLFATRKLILPDQSGLGDEFKRLADYLSQGGARDIRAKRGHDDRSRAVMLAVHQAFSQKSANKPWIASIPRGPVDDFDNPRMWTKV